jgi:HlyD family secretion protein
MRFYLIVLLAALSLGGCHQPASPRYQGYLEGDFIYIGSPLAGKLEKLAVTKGTPVTAGATLFALEQKAELAAQRQTAEQLRATEARLEDLKKGARTSELAGLEARRDQARAAQQLSQLELARVEALHKTNVVSDSDFDRARLTHEQSVRALDELSAQLATAQLGGRPDAILAATAEVSAALAAKERADWNVEQKVQLSPRSAWVYDTLYREGEFVTAGTPVVALLPPENIKARFFVPEADLGALKMGAPVFVSMTGRVATLRGRVSYISVKPEYTPPVLYNRENRAKLVFMVEAIFEGTDAGELHPGQPIDVEITAP